jgi:DNA polymerase III subunit delta'
MTGLPVLLGQDTATATLRRAVVGARVHHAYRFEGPAGVGKEIAALRLAAALLCDAPIDAPTAPDRGDACGTCDGCVRVFGRGTEAPHLPIHPDVLILGRGLYEPGTIGLKSAEKQNISVEQVRRIVLSRVSFPPHEGRARFFLVRDAEHLSVAAANALLKTLEEPPARTHFILMTSRPGELLDTILSRTLAIRFRPLGDTALRSILATHGIAQPDIDRVVPLAGGSASAALAALDPEARAARDAFVDGLVAATQSPDLRAGLALSQARDRDKQVLQGHLAAFATHLATEARASVFAGSGTEEAQAAGFELVQRAITELAANVSPQLVIESLVVGLRGIPRS